MVQAELLRPSELELFKEGSAIREIRALVDLWYDLALERPFKEFSKFLSLSKDVINTYDPQLTPLHLLLSGGILLSAKEDESLISGLSPDLTWTIQSSHSAEESSLPITGSLERVLAEIGFDSQEEVFCQLGREIYAFMGNKRITVMRGILEPGGRLILKFFRKYDPTDENPDKGRRPIVLPCKGLHDLISREFMETVFQFLV